MERLKLVIRNLVFSITGHAGKAGVSWPYRNIQTVDACGQMCADITECTGFHYYDMTDVNKGDCYLHKGELELNEMFDNKGRHAGKKVCSINLHLLFGTLKQGL